MNGNTDNFCSVNWSIRHVIGCELDVMLPLCVYNADKCAIIQITCASQQKDRWNVFIFTSIYTCLLIEYIYITFIRHFCDSFLFILPRKNNFFADLHSLKKGFYIIHTPSIQILQFDLISKRKKKNGKTNVRL